MLGDIILATQMPPPPQHYHGYIKCDIDIIIGGQNKNMNNIRVAINYSSRNKTKADRHGCGATTRNDTLPLLLYNNHRVVQDWRTLSLQLEKNNSMAIYTLGF